MFDGVDRNSDLAKGIISKIYAHSDYSKHSLIIVVSGQLDLRLHQIRDWDVTARFSFSWELEEYQSACATNEFLVQVLPKLIEKEEELYFLPKVSRTMFYFIFFCFVFVFNVFIYQLCAGKN